MERGSGCVNISIYLSISWFYIVDGGWLNVPVGRWCNYMERAKVKFGKKNLSHCVFENRVLRRIFGPKKDEVTREWTKLHSMELNELYSSPNIVRVIKSRPMRWAGHVARMGEKRGVFRVLVGKHEGKKPLGRPRRRWENNIK